MKKFAAALFLTASLFGPVIGFAEEHHRYYDRDRRDWHEWNEHENRAYRHWLMETGHNQSFSCPAGVERC